MKFKSFEFADSLAQVTEVFEANFQDRGLNSADHQPISCIYASWWVPPNPRVQSWTILDSRRTKSASQRRQKAYKVHLIQCSSGSLVVIWRQYRTSDWFVTLCDYECWFCRPYDKETKQENRNFFVCLFLCKSSSFGNVFRSDEKLASKRFTATRGTPVRLFTDNVTNFIGDRNDIGGQSNSCAWTRN